MDMTIVFIWKHTSGSRDEEGTGTWTEQKGGKRGQVGIDRSSRKKRGEEFIQLGEKGDREGE